MKLLIIGLLAGLSANVVSAKDCDYSRTVDRTVNLNGITNLIVEAGAGSLEIRGETGRKDVRIKARLCSSDQDALAEMRVADQVKNNSARFRTVFADSSDSFFQASASIDLVLTVPANAILDASDSSGEATIRQVQTLTMVDSSGELTIRDIAGDVSVTDSSGQMNLKKIGGNVEITDSSGGIYVKDVKQNLLILVDSSGGIDAENIGEDVVVEIDSSGGISVQDVGGDFIVKADTSGGIDYQDVAGEVRLPD